MYATIDEVMAQDLPQTELYCTIGRIVCSRSEKGAAVMASEYIIATYPDAKGFSPRSLRRMRDFYHTYENYPAMLSCAMQIGWIQNVVIMEADLTMNLREWYMRAAEQFGWSKTELITNVAANAHETVVLDIEKEMCCVEERERKNGEKKKNLIRIIKWKNIGAVQGKCAYVMMEIKDRHPVVLVRWNKAWIVVFYIFARYKKKIKFAIRCRGGPSGISCSQT